MCTHTPKAYTEWVSSEQAWVLEKGFQSSSNDNDDDSYNNNSNTTAEKHTQHGEQKSHETKKRDQEMKG